MKFVSSLAILLVSASCALSIEITGKVICGYQGWFRTPDDGSGNGWHHYANRRTFEPGTATIDLWPDVSELPEDARVDTGFKHADDSVAQVFSSSSEAVVKMHFRWMREYGIDGVFIQRFGVIARNERTRAPMDKVLTHAIAEAATTERAWGIMYDLSGLRPGNTDVITEDWLRLKRDHSTGDLEKHPTYLEFKGKPLVALWGFGFSDRAPMWEDWRQLVSFFKDEQGCAVMLGIPTYWRETERDAHASPELHEILKQADIISPWTVGRYNSPQTARRHIEGVVTGDLEWTAEYDLGYMPVSFPGFSWQNLMRTRGTDAELNAIPRMKGRFLWSQLEGYHAAGATMLYVAMFDELDEGTAIMKWSNNPPVGENRFITEPDVPNDRYLKLTGMAGRLLRGKAIDDNNEVPFPDEFSNESTSGTVGRLDSNDL